MKKGMELASRIRETGYAVTTFQGDRLKGPVIESYIVCKCGYIKTLLLAVKDFDPDAFYLTENAGAVNRIFRPTMVPRSGWRAVLKKQVQGSVRLRGLEPYSWTIPFVYY